MSALRTPADGEPQAWIAAAWPDHADWGANVRAARMEIAALVQALADASTVSASPPPKRPLAPPPLALIGAGAPAPPGALLGMLEPVSELRPAPEAPTRVHDTAREDTDPGAHLMVWTPPTHDDPDMDETLLTHPRIHRLDQAYGDIWLRDTGPVFVEGPQGLRAAAFRFNGWGGRYFYAGDDTVAARLARLADVPLELIDMVGEPGALDMDGEGTAIASRRCLLNRNRNPHMGSRDAELLLRRHLGVERVIWLEEMLANDHTDGHVDTLARFVRPGLIVTESPSGPRDVNAKQRDAVASRLDGARDAQGRALDVARVAGASVVVDESGWPLPATHLNYVRTGETVVVPTYEDDAETEAALTDLADVFPDESLAPLSARALITGGGAFHCCTCPAPVGAAGPDVWSAARDDE